MKKATLIVSGVFAYTFAFAQTDNNVEVLTPTEFHISVPLSDLPDYEETDKLYEKNEVEDRKHRAPSKFDFSVEKDGPAYDNDPTSIQKFNGTKALKAPISSFAGQAGGGYPPDPTGAVGPAQYVQAVNATPYKVYNKTTGATIMAAKNIGTLWSPATSNDGDPIVLYDKYADRWVLTQFGLSGNKIYIAVSTTSNPAGTYACYTYTSASFPDYLKFSIWQDGYYMTSNQGGRLYVFERTAMLAGTPTARSVTGTFTVGGTSGFWCPLPADADGTLPPAATPCPFFWMTDNTWAGSVDGVKYCKATVNWVPATPTLSITPAVQITTAAFNGTYSASWDDIPQPGTTQYLDGIGGVATFRAQYRRWTGYNTVVLNWGVLITSSPRVRAIKWVELRELTAGVWTLYQEGIYQPDSKSRWVGSMAMDDNGSIGLAYARSGSAAGEYPSLCYTGRCAGDPLGTMTFTETVAKAGASSQSGINRFGDYSQTSLDPTDGTLFYHTGEYILSGGPATWIFSFRLTPCSTGINDAPDLTNQVSAFSANDLINIKAENMDVDGQLVIDLFDISGKQIDGKTLELSGNSFESSFSTANLSTGTYLVRVGKTNTSFQRVVKVAVVK